MRVGVKILDDAKFRRVLDEGFERFEYALANSDVDEQLHCAHYCHLIPRGRGRAFLLKFTRPLDGDWNTAALLEASTNRELGRSVLDRPTVLEGDQEMQEEVQLNCFKWIDQILAMCSREMNSATL